MQPSRTNGTQIFYFYFFYFKNKKYFIDCKNHFLYSAKSLHFPLRGKVGQLIKKKRVLCWSIYIMIVYRRTCPHRSAVVPVPLGVLSYLFPWACCLVRTGVGRAWWRASWWRPTPGSSHCCTSPSGSGRGSWGHTVSLSSEDKKLHFLHGAHYTCRVQFCSDGKNTV